MAQIARNAGPASLSPEAARFVAKRPVLTELRRVIATWSTRRRSRLALSQLSPSQLRDIGLERTVAADEAARPFWQP